ncbi:uncharacterized protein LTR77_008929 [Saxophila tyrrhenica]|uniref:Heterokaryon incompatibility domain-containing protein n=1 Tax=Saxophila tyrrhenica TaxID=1690608 RepID=A0AAV9NZF8_9PEZI|nr:hypothetical protein LTR77_008929 [Saxophila tyrrhenica]
MALPNFPTLQRPPLRDATKQIRLLELQLDGRQDGGDTIECTLSVHNVLDIAGGYVAVSYVWGESEDARRILIDGQWHPVRLNCWEALRQMKQHGISEPCFVDSICIDQGCHREKAEQVGQMGAIYSGARLVAACLGPEAAGENLAKRLFSANMLSVQASGLNWLRMLEHIASRAYFTRVFTLQECMLAQEVDLFYGEARVPLNVLEQRLNRQRQLFVGTIYLDRLASFLNDFAMMNKMSASIHTEANSNLRALRSKPPSLYSATVIIRYAHRHCKYPRDKLFGLYSLIDPAARARIVIDYEMPLFDVLLAYIGSYRCLQDQGAREAHLSVRGNSEFDTGNLVFMVPRQTREGDVLLSIGPSSLRASPKPDVQQDSRRLYVVCRKEARTDRYSILGPASHRTVRDSGAGQMCSWPGDRPWSYALTKRATISREDLLCLSVCSFDGILRRHSRDYLYNTLGLTKVVMPGEQQYGQVASELEQHVATFLGYDALQQLASVQNL